MTEEEVLDFCKKVNLAKYKWPRKIVFDKVMRNPTGKLMKASDAGKFTGPQRGFQKIDLNPAIGGDGKRDGIPRPFFLCNSR